MPSDRKQFNIRLDPETVARVSRLLVRVSADFGIEVSQSDLFRLGMIELEKKYPNDPEPLPKKGGKK
jgi:hypothetical protein